MSSAKHILKGLIPPAIWGFAQELTSRKTYHARWNALSYEPVRGIKIFFDPSGSWQKKIMSGNYDGFLFKKISALKPDGKVIYDIGAHIGFHSLYFSRLVGSKGIIVSLEPNKANFERLLMNIKGNSEVTNIVKPFNIAASDTSGEMKFTTNDNIESGRSTGGFLDNSDPHWNREVFRQKGFSDTTVRTMPVDDMSKSLNIPEPDIMKIDVEGAEYSVLVGARQMILRKKPVIFVEIHSIAAMFDVTRFLQEVSYKTELINKDPNGVCYLEARPPEPKKS